VSVLGVGTVCFDFLARRKAAVTAPSSYGLLRRNSWPLLIFAAAVLIRLSLFAFIARYYPERFFANDSFEYDKLALNLSVHGRSSPSDRAPFAPEIRRTPVYPLFLAATYRAFGHHPRIAILLQLLLNSLTCVLVYEGGRRILERRITRVIGLLAVVDLSFLRYSAVLLSEALLVFLLSVGCACFVWHYAQRKGGWCIAASGVLFGLSALCKPIALYLPVVLFVLVFVRSRDAICLRSNALFLLSFLITIAPWTIRNYQRFGVPLFSTIRGENLLFYNAAFLEASRDKQSIAAVRSKLEAEVEAQAGGEALGVVERYRILEPSSFSLHNENTCFRTTPRRQALGEGMLGDCFWRRTIPRRSRPWAKFQITCSIFRLLHTFLS